MTPSCYLKAFPLADRPGGRILFSQDRASIIRVSERVYQAIQNGTLSDADARTLAGLGMLVADPRQEKQAMLGFFDRLNAANRGLNLMVVLNMDCNFACVYCYEGMLKGRRYMSGATADRLLDFIRTHFNTAKNDLSIDFYGGEPLLSADRIKSIATASRAFARARGATFRFSMVTNGSLLKRGLVAELVELGLESVKITLDGPAELHNRTRPFKSGAGSFDAIVANIHQTWDLIDIAIGGNYEPHSYPRFVSLLDELGRIGLTPERISAIKFDPVMKQADTPHALPDYKGGCASLNEPWLIDAEAFLREQILKRGYRTQKIRPVTCMVDVQDSYLINFDGRIYKCPALVGHDEFAIGDLDRGLSADRSAYHENYWQNEQCAECGYLPLCFGGCRYMAFIRDGKIGALDCRRDYLDAALETLVKQDARYAAVFARKRP